MTTKNSNNHEKTNNLRHDDQTDGKFLLFRITREEYGHIPPRLERLLTDLADLYAGHWPTHEPCQVEYHDFTHALDVALAAARIMAGWNRANPDDRIGVELYGWTVAAALFHDAGYIKDKGDREGHGGKFTITHVRRGMAMAEAYLRRSGWPARAAVFVTTAIALTDYRQAPTVDLNRLNAQERIAARMLPTADLIGQFGDKHYGAKIDGLFAEFQEMYAYQESGQQLANPVPIFNSAQEIRNTIDQFYENFVAPRLAEFGHLERYLDVYFDQKPNPYRENINRNLANHHNDAGN